MTLAAFAGGNAALFTACWLPGAVLLPLSLGWLLHVTVEQAGQRWGRAASRRVSRRSQPHDALIKPGRLLLTTDRQEGELICGAVRHEGSSR